jgi:hypothetical protein
MITWSLPAQLIGTSYMPVIIGLVLALEMRIDPSDPHTAFGGC